MLSTRIWNPKSTGPCMSVASVKMPEIPDSNVGQPSTVRGLLARNLSFNSFVKFRSRVKHDTTGLSERNNQVTKKITFGLEN